ncbi:MAG: DUF4412 domain-containing protein [Acetobacteraceae bacterium]|nr:DUF4412 domain-containing protein [Acetobacteraceae bacterium]
MARGVLGGLALGVALGCFQSAAAQDRPAILPTRDVAITYRASGPVQGRQQQQDLRVAFTAGGKLMRVEGIGGGGREAGAYVIVDHTTQRMTMVMAQDRRFMEMPANNAFSRGFLLSATMKFVRRGSETVAGLKCTVWDITSADGNGKACLTEDGVMLRGSGIDGKGAILATAVSYAPQPAALFKPPAGFTRLEIPAGLGGRPPGR